jgi:SnoaL-like domain
MLSRSTVKGAPVSVAEDIEAIKQLKARYFRLMDTKQWDRWREAFTDDCRYDGTSRPYSGPDEFCAGTSQRLADATTVHQGHMPEIVLTGPDTAEGIWAMFDRVEFPEARDTGHGVSRGFTGFGHYEEKYRRDDGVWRISFLRLTRLWFTQITGDASPPVRTDYISSRHRDWLAAPSGG